MPPEMMETGSWQRTMPATSLATPPKFNKPKIKPRLESSSVETFRPLDESSESDGVRILDTLAPLERAKYYQHSLNSKLQVLQSWEGAVEFVDYSAGTFIARLYDLNNPAADVSEAEFEILDVSANDIDLLKIGGVFRWMIGYRIHSFGQRERISAIVFRRLPAWNERDVDDAMAEGERLAGTLRVR